MAMLPTVFPRDWRHQMGVMDSDELKAMDFKHVGSGVRVSNRASFYGAEQISIGDGSRIDDFVVLSAGAGGISIGRNVHVAVRVAYRRSEYYAFRLLQSLVKSRHILKQRRLLWRAHDEPDDSLTPNESRHCPQFGWGDM